MSRSRMAELRGRADEPRYILARKWGSQGPSGLGSWTTGYVPDCGIRYAKNEETAVVGGRS
jgi:hypothetical protein